MRIAIRTWIDIYSVSETSIHQKAAIALDILPMLEEEAKERQRLAGGDHGNQHTGGKVAVSAEPQQPPDEPKGRAAEQAAALVGASARNVYRVKKIAVSFRYTDVDSYTYGKETAVMYSAGTAHANLHSLNL